MPVSGICVTAFSSAVFRSDRSDARGHYAIRHLATGSYRLYFANCRGDRYAAQVRPGRIRVHAPRAVRGANFAVELAGTISGAVTGGSPSPAPRQGASTAGTVMARTSAGGRYFFGGLTAGRYLLRYHACAHTAGRVGASGQAIVTAGQLVRVAPVTLRDPLLPGSGPAATRPEIPAHAGITLPARARLTPADLRQREARSGYGGISGRVTDAGGRPIKGICVIAHVRRGSGFIGISTSAQGTYRFDKYLRAGRYTLQFGSCDSGESAGN